MMIIKRCLPFIPISLYVPIGMNSIAVYCGSEVLGKYFPFRWEPVYNTHAEFLAMNVIGVSLWVLISYYMYAIDFFVKIWPAFAPASFITRNKHYWLS